MRAGSAPIFARWMNDTLQDDENMDETLIRRTPWPTGSSRAVVTPLQPSVVYASESPDALDAQYDGSNPGYTYAREGHPNADILATKIDALEGATGGLVVGSGMAAVTATMFGLLRAGDHVVGGDQLYGRSLRMLREDLPRMGIATSLADPTDAGAIAAAIRPETKLILIEVVSNPTLRVADVAAISQIAKARGVRLVIDNTFTTPRAFRAFDHGADVVIHSVTKLLAGHSDATLGWVAARDPADRAAIRVCAVTLGLTASPFDCWLAERGLYSFELRYDRAEANAKALGAALADAPGVARVIYPGRGDHPDHNRAAGLLGDRTGNMLSFEIQGGRAAANAFVRAARNIAFAPTLGDIGTTLSHPATSSHRALTPEARAALGISEGFFRLSVGCEPADLLIAELTAAARAAAG
jgi:cystathionine gamma-synthase